MIAGAPAAEAPVSGLAGNWLLGYLGGDFTPLSFGDAILPLDVAAIARDGVGTA